MNILIINQPLNNRGDESAHKGFVKTVLREIPGVKIKILFCAKWNKKDIEPFIVKDERVKYVIANTWLNTLLKITYIYGFMKDVKWVWYLHPSILKYMKNYHSADMVICAPGGICMGGFQNWEHLFGLYCAKIFHKPLIYYGRSFGPFPTKTPQNQVFKKNAQEMLNYFSFCAIRDKKTEVLAEQLGVNYTSTTDCAFLDSPEVEIPAEISSFISRSSYVVFVPNILIWHYAYKQYSKDLILKFYLLLFNEIIKKYPKHKIVMLPQTYNNGKWRDELFFLDFKNYAKNNDIIVVSDKYSSDIQQSIIKGAACMIGARYHSVVFSLNQAVPFVALSYEHKIAGLLETLGKTDCMVDITTTFESEKRLQETIISFKDKLAHVQADKEACIKAKEIAKCCFDKWKSEIPNIIQQNREKEQ